MSAVDDYLRTLARRAHEPLGPPGFEPDWRDRPLGHKVYPGVGALPLPGPEHTAGAPSGGGDGARPRGPALGFGEAVFGAGPAGAGPARPLPPDALADMLRYSHGLLERRLRVTVGHGSAEAARYDSALWSRGAASGGGLYPCEVYWVTGAGGPMLPGVYHYSPPRHALHRLLAGDVTDRVRAALPDTGQGCHADGFLLVTVKFWKNTFKYADFGYHVVTMDVGCLLETWRLWLRSHGAAFAPALWFADAALNGLLGVATRDESVMAVLPIRSGPADGGPAGDAAADGRPAPPDTPPDAPPPAVSAVERERSRSVLRFDTVQRVHEATLVDARVPPRPGALAAAAADTGPRGDGAGGVTLPRVEHDRLGAPLPELLRRRRSAFGTFAAAPPVPAAALGTLLACVMRTPGALAAGAGAARAGSGLVRLSVLAQHVSGVAPGCYDYAHAEHALHPAAPARSVQDLYTLDNYNLEQAAAVIAVVARPHAVTAALGARGYRLLNAEVGMAAQSCYLAAAALELGCGAALAFDPVGLADRIGLRPDESPLLLLMVGRERPERADLVDRLV